jgi:hypothetical protein
MNTSSLVRSRYNLVFNIAYALNSSAEREIVRAGLSGERWHTPDTQELYVIDETSQINCGIPPSFTTASTPHRWSNFSISRNPSIEEETLSTVHSSDKASSVANQMNITSTPDNIRWWDKLILKDKRYFHSAYNQQNTRAQLELEERELEYPTNIQMGIPGRRLDGCSATTLELPNEFRTRPLPIRNVARCAAVREWEMRIAWHGVVDESSNDTKSKHALLDGRVFFSSKKSYPMAVFSCIKYEPQKEEAARRRKKLEELGGGGTQFVLPERDWSEFDFVYNLFVLFE